MAESENEKPKECETTNWCSNGFIYFQEIEANKQALSCYDQEETHSPIEVYQGILRLLSVLVEYETRIFDTPFKMEGLSYLLTSTDLTTPSQTSDTKHANKTTVADMTKTSHGSSFPIATHPSNSQTK